MHNDKRMTTYLLILLSLFILMFFTRGVYAELQVLLSEREKNEADYMKLEMQKNKLSTIQKEMKDANSDTRQEIERYIADFREDDLLRYFYGYADWSQGKFVIQSMKLSKKAENQYGFKEWTVALSAAAKDHEAIMDFLDSILSEDAPYRFFIERFSIPEEVEWRTVPVSIPLKVFYK